MYRIKAQNTLDRYNLSDTDSRHSNAIRRLIAQIRSIESNYSRTPDKDAADEQLSELDEQLIDELNEWHDWDKREAEINKTKAQPKEKVVKKQDSSKPYDPNKPESEKNKRPFSWHLTKEGKEWIAKTKDTIPTKTNSPAPKDEKKSGGGWGWLILGLGVLGAIAGLTTQKK